MTAVKMTRGQYRPTKIDKYACYDCGEVAWCGYMVVDALWKQTVPAALQKRCLCITCFTTRLGRPLVLQDLSKAPINDTARYFWSRGISFALDQVAAPLISLEEYGQDYSAEI